MDYKSGLKNDIKDTVNALSKKANLSDDEVFVLAKILEELNRWPPSISVSLCYKLKTNPIQKITDSNIYDPI